MNNSASDSYNLYELTHNTNFMEPCLDCGELDEGKLGILMTAVKGYMTAQVGCLPCWWKKVGIRLGGENGRTGSLQGQKIRGNREESIKQAGAAVLFERYLAKGICEQCDRERDQAL